MKTALLLVDIQDGLKNSTHWGGDRNNSQAEENAGRLLDLFRKEGHPVFHVKHNSVNKKSPLFPGQPGNEIQAIVKPITGEPVIEKSVNSGFIGTDLHERLQAQQITSLIIVGLTTDHCVSTTVRMAANMGYETVVVSDATATYDRESPTGEKLAAELIHQVSLVTLHNEFATVLTTEQVLKRITSAHESAIATR